MTWIKSSQYLFYIPNLKNLVICLVISTILQMNYVAKMLWKWKRHRLQFPHNHSTKKEKSMRVWWMFNSKKATQTVICPRHCKKYAWEILKFSCFQLYSWIMPALLTNQIRVFFNPLHDSYNHKHVTSLMKGATTPFNYKYTSQFKRKRVVNTHLLY